MMDLLPRVAERSDTTAFRQPYQSYAPRVKAYMMRRGAAAGTAEDLAHATLFIVWRPVALYRTDQGSAATWICAIPRNLRIDHRGREVPFQKLPAALLDGTAGDALPDAAQKGGRRACAPPSNLPPEQYEPEQNDVVALAVLKASRTARVAARLGLPLGTVTSCMGIDPKIRAGLEDVP